jgi:type IX secretion system PorP/SprF family membrane protein
MKTSFYTVLCLFFTINLKAQDAHFAQPYSSPMLLNPALTGATNTNNRISLQYRQWQQFHQNNLTMVSYEHRYDVKNNDYVGIGAGVWQREASLFEHTELKTSAAYCKYLGGSAKGNAYYLAVGSDISFQDNTLDFRKSGQWAFSGADPNSAIVLKQSALDISTGAIWYAVWKKGKRMDAGIALNHIFNSGRQAIEDSILWQRKSITLHVGCELPLKSQLRLMPAVILGYKWAFLPVLPIVFRIN